MLLILFPLLLQAQTIRYVKQNGTGDGSSWANASGDFRNMVLQTYNGNQLWVAAGTYNISGGTIFMSGACEIYGGFPAEGNPAMGDRDFTLYETIIQGNNESTILRTTSETILIDGLTIAGGGTSAGFGGAIRTTNCNAILRNLTIRDNIAQNGGGIYMGNNYNGLPARSTLENIKFLNNTATNGGGIYLTGRVTMENIVFQNNTANNGGALCIENNQEFRGRNILMTNNNANGLGGGLYANNSNNIELVNGTVVNYINDSSASSIAYAQNSSVAFFNSIVNGTVDRNNSTVSFVSSLVAGSGGSAEWDTSYGTDSGNNIDANPQFADANNGDYSLLVASPAINAGNSSFFPDASTATDLNGNPRVFGSSIDMGAYELQSQPVVIVPYCTPAPSSVDGLGITNFTLGSINNTTGAEPGNYGNYSNLVASVIPGTSMPFSISLETGYSYLTRVWVDWDRNGSFSDGEQVYSAFYGDEIPTIMTGAFTIPENLLPGSYRLRIGGHDNQRGSFWVTPCFTGPYGTFEDYTLGVDYPDPPVVTSFNYGAFCGDSNVITINGTGLEGASLSIGGVAISQLTTNTDTQITANVAAGIGGTVVVTRPGGSFETTETFSVSLPPVISFSEASVTICSGTDSGVMTVSAAENYDTFIWVPSTGVSGNGVAGFTFSPAETTTYTLTANNSVSGCENSAEITIVVNPAPQFSISYVDTEPCAENIVVLSAISGVAPVVGGCAIAPYGPYPGTTYSGDCDGSTVSITDNGWAGEYSPVYLFPGKRYTFTSTGSSDFITITDYPGLVIYAAGPSPLVYDNISVSGVTRFYTHTDELCGDSNSNRSRLFTCEPYIPPTYTWAPIEGLYTDAEGTVPYTGGYADTVYALPEVTTEYTATTTNDVGCSHTEAVSVIVPAELSLSDSLVTICLGGSSGMVTINAGADNYDTFIWEPSGGISGDAVSGFTFNPSETTNYTLTASNSVSGCESAAEIAIVVNPAPVFTVDYIVPEPCADTIVKLTALSDAAPVTGGCLNAPYGAFPGSVLELQYYPCDGETYSFDSCWAGEYTQVEVGANTQYTFTSSGVGDYVTIGNEAGTIVYAAGPSPVVYKSATTEVVRFYTHANSACGLSQIGRTRSLTCEPVFEPYVWSPTTGLYTDEEATIEYTGGSAAIVYARPEVTTEYTVTATNESGCTATNQVTVTACANWTGDVSTQWDEPGNWSGNQVPSPMEEVIIDNRVNQPVVSGSIAAFGNTLTVRPEATLTVLSGSMLNIIGAVKVEAPGQIVLENNANLIQSGITNANTGAIEVHRNSSALFRQDYTLWSSPVQGQGIRNFSVNTVLARFYTYNTATDHYESMFATEQSAAGQNFETGKGYLIRMPNGAPEAGYVEGTTTVKYDGVFTGIPNNGTIAVAVTPATDGVPGYNAIGNPYP
ncbi:MAG: hypothetical protein EOO45_10155, partial [Flavobacterium sp.]